MLRTENPSISDADTWRLFLNFSDGGDFIVDAQHARAMEHVVHVGTLDVQSHVVTGSSLLHTRVLHISSQYHASSRIPRVLLHSAKRASQCLPSAGLS